MPIARFQLPDGRIARFEVPEGTTPEQAQSLIQSELPKISQPEIPQSLQPSVSSGIPGERQPAQELTTGQKVYQAIRPYAAPIVETGGAIAGGLLGGTAGTFGAGPVGTAAGGVAGAGLGYGIGKELVEVADVAMGMKAPRQGAALVVEPTRNVLEGMTAEAGGRVLGPAVGWAAGKVMDLRQIPKQKAAEIARNALGSDLPEVLNTLKAAQGKGVSAAQATADINSPTWQALIDKATARDPRFLRALEQSQGEVSLNALAKLAGGATATETRTANELAKQTLTDITSPARQASLARANKGMDVAALEAEAEALAQSAGSKVDDVRRLIKAGNLAEASARLDLIKKNLPVGFTKYTYKGELAQMADKWASQAADASLDLGQGARFAQSAADTMRAAGIKPLETEPLIANLRSITSNPEFAGNDVMQASVNNLARDLAEWTNKGGIIDAKALDAIRKNSVNAAVRDLLKGQDPSIQREAAAGVMARIKPMLVDAVEAAGGKGYRAYLEDYTKGMQDIAKQKLSGEALRLWKENKDAFVNLVQGNSPDVVEKFLGKGNYDIGTELAEDTLKTLREQAEKRLTELSVKEQVSAGQDALKQLLLQQISKFRIPSYLSMVAATTNKALAMLENRIGTKTMGTLTEALKTPEGAANLLETLPASERSQVLQLIADPTKWGVRPAKETLVGGAKRAQQVAEAIRTGTMTGAVNALAPDRYDNNALNAQPVRRIELNNMLAPD